MTAARERTGTRHVVTLVVLLAAPLLYLAPSVFGPRDYVPFDLAQFPPVATTLTPEELAEIRERPQNPDVTEVPVLVVPEMQLARDELADGRFPHWNPYARFGAPLFANGLAAMAYPFNHVLLVRGDPVANLALAAWLSFAIAGLLAYGFLRELELSWPSALLGALVFAIGGTLAANAHFYMRMNALIWLPGLCWAVLRIGRHHGRARLPGVAALAACTAMTLLAGFPPFAVSSLLAAGLFSTCVLFRTLGFDGPVPMLRVAAFLLAGVGIGAAIAAVQLVPMFDFYPESNREIASGIAALRSDAFARMGFLGYVAPDLFGYPGQPPSPYQASPLVLLLHDVRSLDGVLQYPPNYNFTEYTVFVGSLPFLLALLGAFGPARRCRFVLVASVLVLFLLATAPAGLAAWYGLPVVGSVPPIRYVAPTALFVATLAAFGLDHVLADRASKRTLLFGALGVVVAMMCAGYVGAAPLADRGAVVDALVERYRPGAPTLTGETVVRLVGEANLAAGSMRLRDSLASAGWWMLIAGGLLIMLRLTRGEPRLRAATVATLILFTVGQLAMFGAPLNSGRVLEHDVRDTPIHEFLRERRDAAADRGGITIARAAEHPHEPIEVPSGTLFPERIRDLNAYAFVDAWSSRIFRALYGPAQMIRGYWPMDFPDDPRLERPIFDLLGLRFVLSTDELEHAGRPTGVELRGPGGTFRVYERENAMTRAFIVDALQVLPDDDAVVGALIAPDLAPRASVLITPEEAAELGPPVRGRGAGARDVTFVRDVPDEIVLEVEPGPAGYLVLADAALSGWTATIDGEPTPIARGNLFMRVVAIQEDAERVVFRYDTPGLGTGTAISVAGLVCLLALVWVGFRSRPRHRPADAIA